MFSALGARSLIQTSSSTIESQLSSAWHRQHHAQIAQILDHIAAVTNSNSELAQASHANNYVALASVSIYVRARVKSLAPLSYYYQTQTLPHSTQFPKYHSQARSAFEFVKS